jgi:hypothetical protein
VFQRSVIMARVAAFFIAKGVFAPTDEFDLNNARTPLLDR